VVWEAGRLNAPAGTGRFVKAPPFGSLYNGLADWAARRDEFTYGHMGAAPVQRAGDAAAAPPAGGGGGGKQTRAEL
jgi:hypothetical protein